MGEKIFNFVVFLIVGWLFLVPIETQIAWMPSPGSTAFNIGFIILGLVGFVGRSLVVQARIDAADARKESPPYHR